MLFGAYRYVGSLAGGNEGGQCGETDASLTAIAGGCVPGLICFGITVSSTPFWRILLDDTKQCSPVSLVRDLEASPDK